MFSNLRLQNPILLFLFFSGLLYLFYSPFPFKSFKFWHLHNPLIGRRLMVLLWDSIRKPYTFYFFWKKQNENNLIFSWFRKSAIKIEPMKELEVEKKCTLQKETKYIGTNTWTRKHYMFHDSYMNIDLTQIRQDDKSS